METLILKNTPRGWIATSDDPQVLALFGTYDIPTAFTAAAPPEMVLDEIRRLNPKSIVRLAQ